MRRQHTPEQDILIAAAYATGASAETLAQKYGGSGHTIRAAVRRTGGRVRNTGEGAAFRDHRFTAEDRQQITTEYLAGATLTSLAAKHGTSLTPIAAAIRKCGATCRTSGPPRLFSRPDELSIVAEYLKGATLKALADRWGGNKITMLNILKRENIMTRSNRVYFFNERYFSSINTPEKAYWLGFLAADGYISGQKVGIGLQATDRGHLDKFKKAIGHTGPVSEPRPCKRGPRSAPDGPPSWTCEATAYSSDMVADLAALGIVERKSLILTPWRSDDIVLQAAYWAGCIDGDGGVHLRPGTMSKAQVPSVNFCGTQAMVRAFSDFATAHTHSTRAKAERRIFQQAGTQTWTVSISGLNLCKQLLRLLYSSSGVWLDRKKETADRILALEDCQKDFSGLTSGILLPIYERLGRNWTAVARELGTHRTTIWNIKKRLGL